MAGERAAASSAYGPLAMCFRGGIAAGETGFGRLAAGKRRTDQNMVMLSAQKVEFSVVEVGRGQGGSGWCREPWLYRAAPTGLRGGIAAGETGFGRIAAGKRQINGKADGWAVQKVFFGGDGAPGEGAKSNWYRSIFRALKVAGAVPGRCSFACSSYTRSDG